MWRVRRMIRRTTLYWFVELNLKSLGLVHKAFFTWNKAKKYALQYQKLMESTYD